MKLKKNNSLSLDKFINFSLYDKKSGYYMKKNPFGQESDFITAPNISRLFSEMIAIWIISFWQSLGSPKKFNLVELGAGNGEMMKIIIESFQNFPFFLKSCNFIIHEKSPTLINIQKKYPGILQIKFQDALNFEYSKIKDQKIFLVANLPYHIATTLVIKWLRYIKKFESIIVMVQREVADRLSAKVSTKFYGRTSVLVQLHSNVKKIFDVSPENFHPKPKVDSSIIELTPKSNLNFNYENIDELLKICFAQRRKKLKNNLNKISHSNLQKIINSGVDLNLRPQNISIDNYLMMSKLLF